MWETLREDLSRFFRGNVEGATLPRRRQEELQPRPFEGVAGEIHDPTLKSMLQRYPTAMLPIEDTQKVFKDVSQEQLSALGITQEHLQRFAFYALYAAEYQVANG